MKHPCFTFGYQSKSVASLTRKLRETNALLIDIRCMPYSRQRSWNHDALKGVLGGDYLYLPELGNLNYKGGPTKIVDMEKGCEIVLNHLQRRPVVLMCVCQCLEKCHRNVVAAELEELEPTLTIEEFEI